jgi:hypothetical protein
MGRVRFGTRPIVVLTLALSGALALTTGVLAHDGSAPNANLHINGQVKRLHPWSVTWVHRSGPGCVEESVDGIPNFKPTAEVARLHPTPRIVLRKKQRPRHVRALADNRLKDGYLADGRPLDVTLRARGDADSRVWVAMLHTRVQDRLFVDLNARWRGGAACGGRDDASWDFSLRRSPAGSAPGSS